MADPITAADVQAYLGELGYTIPMAVRGMTTVPRS